MPVWVQLRETLERFTFNDSLGLVALKGVSHKRNFFLIVSHFATLTIIYNIFHLCVDLQRIMNPCNTTMGSEGVRMRIIVFPHLQKSDTGIAAMIKMCLLLRGHIGRELPFPRACLPMPALMPSGTTKP